MARSDDNSSAAESLRRKESRHGAFATTHWSVVLEAGRGDITRSAAALEQLCQRYWHPIYAFIRRRGSGRPEAEDLTQAFFEHLLDKETLKKVDPSKGKFRTFLLASLTHFLANDWDKRQAWKRGGRLKIISLDEAAEELYGREAVEKASPEKLFDRRWAALLVTNVLAELKQEYSDEKKAALFARLEPALTGELPPGWHAASAQALDMGEGAVRVAFHRLRRRFGELLRREIAQTVTNAAEVDEELRQLFSVMSS
jgi:RNA polymerase sigma factor (sigma-70 family)